MSSLVIVVTFVSIVILSTSTWDQVLAECALELSTLKAAHPRHFPLVIHHNFWKKYTGCYAGRCIANSEERPSCMTSCLVGL